MSLIDLLPAVGALPRPEKQRLLDLLAAELSREADAPALDPGADYPVWTPYGDAEAAGVLLDLLRRDGAAP